MELFPANPGYSLYFVTNLAGSVVSSAAMILIYAYRRYMFVKPSVMILGCYHILAQWPLVLLSAFLENFLPFPWSFAALVHGFVLIGLLISYFSFDRSAAEVWARLPNSEINIRPPYLPVCGVLGIAFVLAAAYLWYIPFNRTGLYALLFNPSNASEAREFSLKLLGNWQPKWALTLLSNTIAPLFTALVTYFILLNRHISFFEKCLWVIGLVLCWAMSIFNGAKGILVFLIFVALGTVAWRYHLKLSIRWIIGGVCIILLPAVVITLLLATVEQTYSDLPQTSQPAIQLPPRATDSNSLEKQPPSSAVVSKATLCARRFEAGEISSEREKVEIPRERVEIPRQEKSISSFHRKLSVNDVLVQMLEINKRSFVLPTVVAAWFADYAQGNNPIGLAGIPRVASVLGIKPIDLPNRVGVIYAPCYYGHQVMDTINATTGFLFAQYGYFGLAALPLALIGLFVCDGLLLIFRALPTIWLVPTLAVVSLDALKLTQSDYLTIWITHGLAINLVLIVALVHLSKRPLGNATVTS